MEIVYVEDSNHPNGGYICNKDEVPNGAKTLTMKQFEKQSKSGVKIIEVKPEVKKILSKDKED